VFQRRQTSGALARNLAHGTKPLRHGLSNTAEAGFPGNAADPPLSRQGLGACRRGIVTSIYWAWAISAGLLLLLSIILGLLTETRSVFGILIDARGRMSLTHLQLTMWTILILSLISGVFWGRLLSGVHKPLEFEVPNEVLGLMGIAVASAVATTITKSAKDNDPEASARIAVPDEGDTPKLSQIFLLEEGALADEVIDITKFQNFVLTVILVVAYTAVSIDAIRPTSAAKPLTALPGLDPHFLTLLGISHAGYIAGKLPKQSGAPGAHTTLADRNQRKQAAATAARAARLEAAHEPTR